MDKTVFCTTWAEFGPHMRRNRQQGPLERPTNAQVAFFFSEIFGFQREAELQNCETNSKLYLKIIKFACNIKQRVENPY